MSEKDEEHGHHPSTFKAVCTNRTGIAWDDHATVQRKADGQGLFNGLKSLHRGTLAEMVALVSRMPPGERENYVILKAGDHALDTGEILSLASRADFPLRS